MSARAELRAVETSDPVLPSAPLLGPAPDRADGSVRPADPVVARADAFLAWLATTSGADVPDADRVDRIAAFERVKGALAAAQIRQTAAFAASQEAAMPTWTPPRAVARSIGSQVALARRESPTRGDAHLALARAMTRAMPQTLAALTAGQISESAAENIHRALEVMDPDVVQVVDDRLAPDLARLGERSLAEAARRHAAGVDDAAASRRTEQAALSRRVTLRMARDGMAYFTLLAPMAEATGAYQAVEAETARLLGAPSRAGRRAAFWLADPTARLGPSLGETFLGSDGRVEAAPVAAGPAGPAVSGRTRSQLMADLVVSRLTGRAVGQPVPIEIQLVMTDQSLGQPLPDRNPSTSSWSPRRRLSSGNPAKAIADAGHLSPTTPATITRAERLAPTTPPTITRAERLAPTTHATITRAERLTPTTPATITRAERLTPTTPPAITRAERLAPRTPAKILGAGWLPSEFARDLVLRTSAAGSHVSVRRVVTTADGATVIGLEGRRHSLNPSGVPTPTGRNSPGHDPIPRGFVNPDTPPTPPVLAPTTSTQRLFRGILRRMVEVRDQECRTPFCSAAIRAADHVRPARDDGPTSAHNAEGKCDRCNLTKEAPGWTVVVTSRPPVPEPDPGVPPWQQFMDGLLADDAALAPDTVHRTAVITPTGHVYESTAPAARDTPGRESEARTVR